MGSSTLEKSSESNDGRLLSRRALFSAGALTSALAAATSARGQALGNEKDDGDANIQRRRTPGKPEYKLVRRATMGLNKVEAERIDSLGFDGWLEYQLDYESINDNGNETLVKMLFPTITKVPYDIFNFNIGQIRNDLIGATIYRSAFSERQLYQRMVEFWTDHFNIDIVKNGPNFLKTIDDREVIRQHALGNFKDMLIASATSPAMLIYLDNNTNKVGNPNENYARELMELHTLGVDGGYTQQDVEEVSRCFTGWTWWGGGLNRGLFRYYGPWHDNEEKVVLGQTIPAGGGIQDGYDVLDILAAHPSTAMFIATKLVRFFYGYVPHKDIVDPVADAYLQTGGDIKAMLRALLTRQNMLMINPKYKRPYYLVTSAMRALGSRITNTRGLIFITLNGMGQLPFFWGPPDGYPDTLDHWVGLVLPRWNFAFDIGRNTLLGVLTDINLFFNGANTKEEIVARMNERLHGGEMPLLEQAELLAYLPDVPPINDIVDALGLALSSPSFQWH